jgi:hypothetical protein
MWTRFFDAFKFWNTLFFWILPNFVIPTLRLLTKYDTSLLFEYFDFWPKLVLILDIPCLSETTKLTILHMLVLFFLFKGKNWGTHSYGTRMKLWWAQINLQKFFVMTWIWTRYLFYLLNLHFKLTKIYFLLGPFCACDYRSYSTTTWKLS